MQFLEKRKFIEKYEFFYFSAYIYIFIHEEKKILIMIFESKSNTDHIMMITHSINHR